jgi:hypothetical protein
MPSLEDFNDIGLRKPNLGLLGFISEVNAHGDLGGQFFNFLRDVFRRPVLVGPDMRQIS